MDNNVLLSIVVDDGYIFGFTDPATRRQAFLLQNVDVIVIGGAVTQRTIARTVIGIQTWRMDDPGPVEITGEIHM